MISSFLTTQALIFTRNKDNTIGPQAGLSFYEEVWGDGAALTKRQMCSLSTLPYVNPSFEWKSGIFVLDVWLKNTKVNRLSSLPADTHCTKKDSNKDLFVILA